jgi:hypothetical protein
MKAFAVPRLTPFGPAMMTLALCVAVSDRAMMTVMARMPALGSSQGSRSG